MDRDYKGLLLRAASAKRKLNEDHRYYKVKVHPVATLVVQWLPMQTA
jgi:hypothetical protein